MLKYNGRPQEEEGKKKKGKKRREKVKGKVETFPLNTGSGGSDK